MAGEGQIETGVDKLVSLIENRKRVSTTEAAKALGVSTAVIDEWADFLEEEKLISIEYKLATTYLVERKLSKKEVVKKAKEFHGSKDAFVRKIETALVSMDRDTAGLEKLKEQFTGLKKEIGSDIDHVRDELRELENYEKLKKNIDRQMYEQQREYKKKTDEIEKELMKERSKFKEIIDDIDVEKIRLQEEKSELLSLREQEAKMLSKLDDFRQAVKQIRKSIEGEESKISVAQDHVNYLSKVAEKAKERIMRETEKLEPLIRESREHEKKILETQQKVIAKVSEGGKKIRENVAQGRAAAESFKRFFDSKLEIEKMLRKVEKHRDELRDEMHELIRKAHAFDLASKQSNIKKYMGELNRKFAEIEKKKSSFRSEIDKLVARVRRSFS